LGFINSARDGYVAFFVFVLFHFFHSLRAAEPRHLPQRQQKLRPHETQRDDVHHVIRAQNKRLAYTQGLLQSHTHVFKSIILSSRRREGASGLGLLNICFWR
jgi:hypothetical protein